MQITTPNRLLEKTTEFLACVTTTPEADCQALWMHKIENLLFLAVLGGFLGRGFSLVYAKTTEFLACVTTTPEADCQALWMHKIENLLFFWLFSDFLAVLGTFGGVAFHWFMLRPLFFSGFFFKKSSFLT